MSFGIRSAPGLLQLDQRAPLVIEIATNVAEVNILTLAAAAGYRVATQRTGIIVNVADGVTVSGSSTHAMRTGALGADSDLTININGNGVISGFTGGTGGSNSPGGVGGDALYVETVTGGNAEIVLNVAGSATCGGGKGGGGGGGARGRKRESYDDKNSRCEGANVFGSAGNDGAAGANLGLGGSQGNAGNHSNNPASGNNCGGGANANDGTAPGAGGAGGAAGFAVRKNSRTVTVNSNGTVAGTAG